MHSKHPGLKLFLIQVGLPSKSNVAGLMMVVVPNVMGMCIFSPRLNSTNNSVRGVQFCKVSLPFKTWETRISVPNYALNSNIFTNWAKSRAWIRRYFIAKLLYWLKFWWESNTRTWQFFFVTIVQILQIWCWSAIDWICHITVTNFNLINKSLMQLYAGECNSFPI